MRRARILIFCNDWPYFVAHRRALFADLDHGKWEIIACCGGPMPDAPDDDLITYRRLSCDRFRFSPLKDVRMFFEVLRAIWIEKPVAVHTITIKPNLAGGLAVRIIKAVTRRRIRLSMMFAGLGRVFDSEDGWRSRLRLAVVRTLLRAGMRQPDACAVFENFGDRRTWVQAGISSKAQTRVLAGTGVDTAFLTPSKDKPPQPPLIALFASRALKSKGIGTVIEAARILSRTDLPVRIVIAAVSSPADRDHYDVDPSRLPPNVDYVGFSPDVKALLETSHVVCLPTAYGEGLPRILLEGAAMRCALVATDLPGCRRIVFHDETGLLVPCLEDGARPQDVADAIAYLAENPGERARMAENAFRAVRDGGFDQKDVNAAFRSVLLGS